MPVKVVRLQLESECKSNPDLFRSLRFWTFLFLIRPVNVLNTQQFRAYRTQPFDSQAWQLRPLIPPSFSEMHPCLAIPEIFSLICKEIGQQSFRSGDLASLARTCRAWTEIALDSLWYQIDRIDPLIECMPRDLWERDEDDYLVSDTPENWLTF